MRLIDRFMPGRRGALPVAVAVAVTLSGGLAACGGGEPDPDPNAVVRIAIAEPGELIPSESNQTAGWQVLGALFTPLVGYDSEHLPSPVAAESITPSTDARVWTIRLRPGYTFHNGEPVTADSYLRAWNYAAYGPNKQSNRYLFARIEGYEALNPPGDEAPTTETLSGLAKVDDLTFTVTLTAPFRGFASMLGYPAFYPLPRAAFTPDGALRETFSQAPIGNGPFRMADSRRPGGLIQVTRYENYAGPAPRIGGVEFVSYREATSAYADLLDGNVDVVTRVPRVHVASAKAALGERFHESPSSDFQFLAFPAFDERFADVDVRRAISMAINRDRIVSAVFGDSQAPARSFTAPVVPGFRENTCGTACEFHPTTAKHLYAKADGPERITIAYNENGGHRNWVETICGELRDHLEVACVAAPAPKFTDLLTKLDSRESLGVVRLGWSMDYPSMRDYLGPLYTTGGSSNYHGYSNPEFDQLVAAGAAASSTGEAIATYQSAEDLLARDLPVIPLRYGQDHFAHSTTVRNVAMGLFHRIDLTRIEAIPG